MVAMRILLIALALLGAAACGTVENPEVTPRAQSTSSPQPQKDAPSKPSGEEAPDFTVTTFDGERFSLGEQRGTPVVLNFWESW